MNAEDIAAECLELGMTDDEVLDFGHDILCAYEKQMEEAKDDS